jgi:protein TonB
MKSPLGFVVGILLVVCTVHAQDRVYTPNDSGVVLPAVTKQVKAEYTREAMQNRIEGTVTLSTVVKADGTVGDVTVTESLDSVYGLDKEAVKAMKQYEFKPGTKDGKPVAVRVAVQMKFSLQ